jgi:hypothetical protein
MADTKLPGADERIQPASSPTPASMRSGLGIAALILGIVALGGSAVPVVNYGAAVVALVGLVLAVVAIVVRSPRRGVALAGAVVSVVALIVSAVFVIVYSVVLATVAPEVGPASAPPAPDTGKATHEGAGKDDLGTRDNPAPLGTPVEVDSTAGTVDWEVTLGPAALDADDVITAENRSTEAAPTGMQYAMVPVTVVYRGTERGTPWAELAVDFVSADGAIHTSSDSFAVAPTPLTDVEELSSGASGTGNVVVAVPTADVEKGNWSLSTVSGERYFFAAE